MKKWLKYLCVLLVAGIIGYILMFAAYLLPIERIKNNVYATSKEYWTVQNFPRVIYENDATIIGNETDELMLLEAVFEGNQSLIEKTTYIYHYNIENNGYHYVLYDLDKIWKGEEWKVDYPYPRYWHGYLIILKPLLMIMNHDEIRYLNLIIQPLLLIYTLFLMVKRKLTKYSLPLACSLLVLYPMNIALTMQFSIIYYILFISLILLLIYLEKIKNEIGLFFLLIGIATCYFDYLTWPLVTLMIPLCLYLLLNQDSIKNNVKVMFITCFCWAIGYIGMWMLKFGLGSLLTGENLFIDGINQIIYRSSSTSDSMVISRLDVLSNVFKLFDNVVFRLITIATLITLVAFLFRNRKNIQKNRIINNLGLLVISLSPIVWFEVTINHSYIHYWMVYRIMMITFFTIPAYVLSIVGGDEVEPE